MPFVFYMNRAQGLSAVGFHLNRAQRLSPVRFPMKRYFLLVAGFLAASVAANAHDIITTPITWSREISRIVYKHCASCHHEGGKAFSLMTYSEARPWTVAIKEEILTRRMPPWGAIKGFGDFRNDQGLTPEQMELVISWADGGVPEGEAKDLPPPPKDADAFPLDRPTSATLKGAIAATGEFKLTRAITVDGLWPKTIADHATTQIMAELPDGDVMPLLWLSDYRPEMGHSFLFRTPMKLPAGTIIHGVPADATVMLLPGPATSALQPAHQSAPYSPRPSAGTGPTPGKSSPAEKSR
jgi:hypothetical protein